MNAIEGRLDPEKFFRIHRSRIVNMERIQEMQPWLNGNTPSCCALARA